MTVLIIVGVILFAALIAYLVYRGSENPKPPIPPPPPPPPPPGGGILPTGVHLTVINQSSSVTVGDVDVYVNAQQSQIDRDFQPAGWGGQATIDTKPGGWPIYLIDNTDVANALGYHDVDGNGVPFAKVFVRTSEQNGVSWQSVASHEVLETLGDSNANTTVVGPNGCNWYRETGDPVEDLSYQINGVELSDFVTPSWFTSNGQAPFDFLRKLSAPFTVTPGGYAASDCGQITGSRHAEKGWSVDKDYE